LLEKIGWKRGFEERKYGIEFFRIWATV